MAYTLPTLSQTADVWLPGHTPASDPADIAAVPVQLYYNSRPIFGGFGALPPGFQYLMEVRASLVGPLFAPLVGGILGVTLENGLMYYYRVVWWDILHSGFPNAYWAMVATQCDNAGVDPDPSR